ncbi:MAG: negative regulator of flagellin synthesis FlgM [Pseudomonadota bacterium]
MKIGSIDLAAVTSTPASTERRRAAGGAPGAPEPVESARVELSANASVSASGEGSFDQAKVDRISQAIRDGTFKVDPGAIADKLIYNAQELLGRVSR